MFNNLLISIVLFCNGFLWIDINEPNNNRFTTSVIELKEELIDTPSDSSISIGFVNDFYFADENEFYIDLQFKFNIEVYSAYRTIPEKGDSIIYADDENIRTRIPFEIAENYFELSGLEQFNIYSKKHELITTSEIKRIEFLNQNISPKFIAVFESKKMSKGESYYYIGNNSYTVDTYEVIKFENHDLTQEMVDNFKIELASFSEVTHYQQPNGNTISILNSHSKAFIIENTRDRTASIIYESNERENIIEVLFIPIVNSEMPVLLVQFGVPESDIFRDSILVYDGNEYIVNRKQ